MLPKTLAITTLIALVTLSALLQSTSPSTIHPLGILFVFVLFYIAALGVLTFFMFWLSRLLAKAGPRTHLAARPMTARQAYYYGSVIALAPVLLVGMRSIGRGTAWDFVLVVLFEIIACFYIAKRQ